MTFGLVRDSLKVRQVASGGRAQTITALGAERRE